MVLDYIPPIIPTWRVVNGPSREALFDALRLLPEERALKFEFITPAETREEIELKILAIEATNNYDDRTPNGGKVWIVKGIDIHLDAQGDRICLLYYATQSRTGTIQIGATGIIGPSLLPVDERPREGFFLCVYLTRYGEVYINGEQQDSDYAVAWMWVGPFGDNDERKEFLANFPNLLEEYDAPEGIKVCITTCNVIQETVVPVVPRDFSLNMLKEFPQSDDDFWGYGDMDNPGE